MYEQPKVFNENVQNITGNNIIICMGGSSVHDLDSLFVGHSLRRQLLNILKEYPSKQNDSIFQ